MKLSIITYVFVTESNNRLPLLKRAIHSIKNQQVSSYEHIIVDDGSTINIYNELNLDDEPNIRYIKKENTGITLTTETYNTGFKEAKGEYLIILSSDDEYVSNSLHHFVDYLDNNDDVAVVGRANYIDETGVIKPFLPSWNDASTELLIRGNFINGCAIMFRNSLFELGMLLPPNITSFCADYDMWVRVSELGSIARLDKEIVNYFNHADATRKKTRQFVPARGLTDESIGNNYPFRKPARLRYVRSSAEFRRSKPKKEISIGSIIIRHIYGKPEKPNFSIGSANTQIKDIITEAGVHYFTRCDNSDLCLRDGKHAEILKEIACIDSYSNYEFHIIGCRANAALITRSLPKNTIVHLYYESGDINLRWIQEIDWGRISSIKFDSAIVRNRTKKLLGLDEHVSFELAD